MAMHVVYVVQMDCFGHGTAVASVAATRNGVASDALLGAYRVFGCFGSSTEAIIVPAIDRAVRDGCHIINLSLSAESGYAEGVSVDQFFIKQHQFCGILVYLRYK